MNKTIKLVKHSFPKIRKFEALSAPLLSKLGKFIWTDKQ